MDMYQVIHKEEKFEGDWKTTTVEKLKIVCINELCYMRQKQEIRTHKIVSSFKFFKEEWIAELMLSMSYLVEKQEKSIPALVWSYIYALYPCSSSKYSLPQWFIHL